MYKSSNQVVSDFLFYAKNHRILIHPDTRKIGIRDTLVAWGLIGLATVLFQDSIKLIPPNLNYLIQFFSAAIVLGISGLFKGISFFGFAEESAALDRSHELKAHLSPKERIWILLTRSIIATGGYMLYSWARVSLGIIDNSAIFSADAIVYAFLMLCILKERIYRTQWVGVIIASIGVSYVFLFDFQFSSWTQAISGGAAGILSSFALSIIILMNTVVVQHEPPLRIAFYQCIVGIALSAIIFGFQYFLVRDVVITDIPIHEILYAVSAGIIYGIALIFFFSAFLYTEPLVISVLGYFLTPFVAFFSWTITKDVIPARDTISAVLISLGGAFVIFSEYRGDKRHIKKKKELFAAQPTYLRTLEEKMGSLKKEYKSGKIQHHDYISQRHEFNKILFQFAAEIKDTNIEKIEIGRKAVIFFIRPYNIKIECDRGFKAPPFEILNFSCFENEESEFMYSLIKDGDVIFDVGARIGWYSINFAKRFPNSEIYAFEPVHINFSFLKKNIQHNSLNNVRFYNYALVNREGEGTLLDFIDEGAKSFNQKVSELSSHKKIHCYAKRLDDFCSGQHLESLDLIKSDVVGAEFEMIKGGIETIKRFKPIIVFRLASELYEMIKDKSLNEAFIALRDLGYRCFSFIGLEEINAEVIEKDNLFFFALQSEKHANLINGLSDKEILIG